MMFYITHRFTCFYLLIYLLLWRLFSRTDHVLFTVPWRIEGWVDPRTRELVGGRWIVADVTDADWFHAPVPLRHRSTMTGTRLTEASTTGATVMYLQLLVKRHLTLGTVLWHTHTRHSAVTQMTQCYRNSGKLCNWDLLSYGNGSNTHIWHSAVSVFLTVSTAIFTHFHQYTNLCQAKQQ